MSSKSKKIEELAPDQSEYDKYEHQREHIRDKPGMYIGSVRPSVQKSIFLVFTPEGPKMHTRTTETIYALEHLFREVICNAGDNLEKTRLALAQTRNRSPLIELGAVEIQVTRTTVTVINGGFPIPVEIKEGQNNYVPYMIFGECMSGSNFKKKRNGVAGTYGFGVKLCNIFSKHFEIDIGDPIRKKRYRQEWKDGMSSYTQPIIEPYEDKAYVKVSYTADFKYFGIKEYGDEYISLFGRHSCDMSFNSGVPVIYNGQKLDYSDIVQYGKLYLGEFTNYFIHTEWPEGTTPNERKTTPPSIRMLVVDTPDEGEQISFVNGTWTRDGGVHVNAAYHTISGDIIQKMDKLMVKFDVEEKEKGEDLPGKKKKKGRSVFDIREFKNHVSLILTCRLEDPEFIGQTKNQLDYPTPSINVPSSLLKQMENWDLIARLRGTLELRLNKKLAETDGKKVAKVEGVPNLDDANEAGSALSEQCTCFFTEGLSAKSFVTAGTGKEGRDFYGVYPLTGKPLNVMNFPFGKKQKRLYANKVYREIKAVLGLKEGLDYSIDANFKTLRYGRLVILADADMDGKHIQGLIICMMHEQFPGLAQRGFIWYMKTQLITVVGKGKNPQKFKFYTMNAFHAWLKENNLTADELKKKGWSINYYKGLGTSEASDAREEFQNPRIIKCLYDDSTPEVMKLAFDPKYANERKKWILDHAKDLEIDAMEMQPISEFLYYEFVQYSICNVERSIPSFMDGLKESQRKIMWGVYLKFQKQNGGWKKEVLTGECKKVKVLQLGGHVAQTTGYHYGEQNLYDTITLLGQGYPGTNNLPLLYPSGNFGHRKELGKDKASARYIFTYPQWWIPLVFRDEDFPLLKLVEEEGEPCEPEFFLPILPIQLLNGATGIATGFSTSIPQYNPRDVVNWLRAKLKGETTPYILPWYRGFTGKIELQVRIPKPATTEESEIDESEKEKDPLGPDELPDGVEYSEEDDLPLNSGGSISSGRLSMVVSGVFREEGEKVIVTELPITRSFVAYKEFLTKLMKMGVITDWKDYCDLHTPYFEIYGMKEPTLEKLRLKRTFGLSNMNLLDSNKRPIKYKDTQEILEVFYHLRMPYYDRRREYILASIKDQLEKVSLKLRFLYAVLAGELVIFEKNKMRPEAELFPEMEKLNLPTDLLRTAIGSLTEDKMRKLEKEEQELKDEYARVSAKSAAQMWLEDLDEFMVEYSKHYAEDGTCLDAPPPESSAVESSGKGRARGRSSKPRTPKLKSTTKAKGVGKAKKK